VFRGLKKLVRRGALALVLDSEFFMMAVFGSQFLLQVFKIEWFISTLCKVFSGIDSASEHQESAFVASWLPSCRDLCVDKIQHRQMFL
tara:strand:+ start:1302 stop:1565 length:264 start_codon:yes stop_codon:yes gene_type:complete